MYSANNAGSEVKCTALKRFFGGRDVNLTIFGNIQQPGMSSLENIWLQFLSYTNLTKSYTNGS